MCVWALCKPSSLKDPPLNSSTDMAEILFLKVVFSKSPLPKPPRTIVANRTRRVKQHSWPFRRGLHFVKFSGV